jgi:hypothetical protein
MKKIILIGFAFSLLSTGAFAATTFTSSGADTTVAGVLVDFKASKQVSVIVLSAPQTYGAISDHLNGTRIYGTASGDSLLYFNETDKTAGTQATATDLSASDSSAFVNAAGWSAL